MNDTDMETVELIGGPCDGDLKRIHATTNTLHVKTVHGHDGIYRRGMGRKRGEHHVFLWEGVAA